jgi:uncharacterized protein
VAVSGRAECLSVEPDIDRAIKYIKQRNPAFSPASNRTWIDSWGHGEAIAIYRIAREHISGRATDGANAHNIHSLTN